jgi:hypothetical protein
MPIEFSCSGCSNTLRVPDEHAGKHARCPQCSSVNTIPMQSQPADATNPPPTPDLFGGLPSQQQPQTPPPAAVNPYGQPPQQQQPYGNASPYAAPQAPYQNRHYAPHRGGLILTLGILSFFCNFMLIPGILAWVMGRSDLKEIKAGRMDPTGEGLTTAGMVIGIISTALVGLILLFYIVIIIIGIGAGVAGGM